MSAIIAMPTHPDRAVIPNQPLDWEGVVRSNPLVIATNRYGPRTLTHPALDDLWAPEWLGRALVEGYWHLGANIQRWWDHYIGDHLGDPDAVLASNCSYPIGVRWTYVGAQRGLHIIHFVCRDDGTPSWYIGAMTWDCDPADIDLRLTT